MRSSGSSFDASSSQWEYKHPASREPKRCMECSEPLEVYGYNKRGDGRSWQTSLAAMNSAVSNLCGVCYCASLSKRVASNKGL